MGRDINEPRDEAQTSRELAVLGAMVGDSVAIQRLKSAIRRIACVDAHVLVTGETGTGKEVAARAIHYLGRRAQHPFVPVNCGAIPGDLLENELFGHQRGAFTDAREASSGLVRHAEGGTLFLDEVDAIPLLGQVKLLQFLQSKVYRPLGGGPARSADVRVLAATNRDLLERVRDGTFREDLYYRINIIPLSIPSLRERVADIALLARHFLSRYAPEGTLERWRLMPALLAALEGHAWPGNVRELENVIQQLLALHEPGPLDAPDLPERLRRTAVPIDDAWEFRAAKRRAIAAFEREYTERLLRAFGGNITRAARAAGQDRRALGRLVKRAGVKSPLPPIAERQR